MRLQPDPTEVIVPVQIGRYTLSSYSQEVITCHLLWSMGDLIAESAPLSVPSLCRWGGHCTPGSVGARRWCGRRTLARKLVNTLGPGWLIPLSALSPEGAMIYIDSGRVPE